MNFQRGKQVLVYDQRVRPTTRLGRNTCYQMPRSFGGVRVYPGDPIAGVLQRARDIARDAGGIDILHILAHGQPGEVQLGLEGLSEANVDELQVLRGLTSCIVFFSCKLGAGTQSLPRHRPYFGTLAQRATDAMVVMAHDTQLAYIGDAVDYGDLRGPVYVFEPGGWSEHQASNPFRRVPQRFNLEQLVFGAAAAR